jgi:hypothetical protein
MSKTKPTRTRAQRGDRERELDEATRREIERRAHERYRARGGAHGSDLDHWLAAARTILGLAEGQAVISTHRHDTRSTREMWSQLSQLGYLGAWSQFERRVREYVRRFSVVPEQILVDFVAYLDGVPAHTVLIAGGLDVSEVCVELDRRSAVSCQQVH